MDSLRSTLRSSLRNSLRSTNVPPALSAVKAEQGAAVVKAEQDAQSWEEAEAAPRAPVTRILAGVAPAWTIDPRSGRFPTTLADSPATPLSQSGFTSTLADAWPWAAGTNIVRRLFVFWNPHRDERAAHRRQSVMLELSAVQHAALYAIAGCDDVQFRIASINVATRDCLERMLDIDKAALALWFKNRGGAYKQRRVAAGAKRKESVLSARGLHKAGGCVRGVVGNRVRGAAAASRAAKLQRTRGGAMGAPDTVRMAKPQRWGAGGCTRDSTDARDADAAAALASLSGAAECPTSQRGGSSSDSDGGSSSNSGGDARWSPGRLGADLPAAAPQQSTVAAAATAAPQLPRSPGAGPVLQSSGGFQSGASELPPGQAHAQWLAQGQAQWQAQAPRGAAVSGQVLMPAWQVPCQQAQAPGQGQAQWQAPSLSMPQAQAQAPPGAAPALVQAKWDMPSSSGMPHGMPPGQGQPPRGAAPGQVHAQAQWQPQAPGMHAQAQWQAPSSSSMPQSMLMQAPSSSSMQAPGSVPHGMPQGVLMQALCGSSMQAPSSVPHGLPQGRLMQALSSSSMQHGMQPQQGMLMQAPISSSVQHGMQPQGMVAGQQWLAPPGMQVQGQWLAPGMQLPGMPPQGTMAAPGAPNAPHYVYIVVFPMQVAPIAPPM
ncbi:hypothetical protein FOA52_004207 [Chlamydomonas sp. UWO 241]|nr:hypothetical protein FOA52_004207 [Chlamydomonas sp. UWO 241]